MPSSRSTPWLLDANEDLALCLMFGGQQQERHFKDSGRAVEIGWDGPFSLDGGAFAVTTEHPLIGTRVIMGYPLNELRRVIDKAQTFDKRFNTLILQEDAVDLTPELVERLLADGWETRQLDEAVQNGARYSPSRNSRRCSVLPTMTMARTKARNVPAPQSVSSTPRPAGCWPPRA